MALPSTLKRHDPSSNDNDSLNDDDDDVTWGGKRPRFIYNFVLDDSPLSYDSDETESVHSGQSKSTIQLLSEVDVSVCGSSCSNCNSSDMTEFEVRSTCSSYNLNDSNFTDSSTAGSTMEYIKTEDNLNITMCDKAVPEDEGYLPEDVSDSPDSNWRLKWPPPACFRDCLQCGKSNTNPFFQYCYKCFKNRREYFEDKPPPKKKSNKHLSSQKKEENPHDSQEPDLPNSQESTSSGYSSLLLSQEENKNLIDLETTSTAEKNKNSKNLCNICFQQPKDGIFNHNKIGHLFSCYKCAKKIWKSKGKCPVCNRKIKFVTKLIFV